MKNFNSPKTRMMNLLYEISVVLLKIIMLKLLPFCFTNIFPSFLLAWNGIADEIYSFLCLSITLVTKQKTTPLINVVAWHELIFGHNFYYFICLVHCINFKSFLFPVPYRAVLLVPSSGNFVYVFFPLLCF